MGVEDQARDALALVKAADGADDEGTYAILAAYPDRESLGQLAIMLAHMYVMTLTDLGISPQELVEGTIARRDGQA